MSRLRGRGEEGEEGGFLREGKMEVMENHTWFDDDIEKVTWESYSDVREINLKPGTECVQICKADVIALAKEFNLVVYEKDAAL